MGKRKIGEIYNKPIVEGDKNLVTNNEIHKSELSGGSGSGEDTMEYLDVSGLEDDFKKSLFLFSHTMRVDGTRIPYTMPSVGFLADVGISRVGTITKISINFSQKMSDSVSVKTVLDRLLEIGTKEELDAIPRITKEEFYSLN